MVQTLPGTSTAVAPAVTTGPATRAWSFARHFLEMCAGMCVGWMVIGLPLLALAVGAGEDEPVRAHPQAAVLLAATVMSIGMAPVMRWRGHSWQCVGEMTVAMFVEAAVLLALAAAGVLASADLFAWFHGLMPVAMIAAMLPRWELYSAPVGRHRHGQ
jgi:hypothetical protein